MQFNREQSLHNYGIYSYSPGEISVTIPNILDDRPPLEDTDNIEQLHLPLRRETLHQSLVIMPNELIRNWGPQSFDTLSREHFEVFTEYDLELVLFGSGSSLRWPDTDLLIPLLEKGLGLEVMDTGAACRTYNILLADQRRFAAALLMI